jgi:hypothetical protein
MYYVDGEIGVPGWNNIGNFEVIMTSLNEKISAFAQIRFGP